MINENTTFKLFGYTSNILSPESHRKVLRICNNCKEERLIEYRNCRDLCLKCSHNTKEYKLKISKARSGQYHTKETKRKISKTNSGKHHTEKSKQKMSKIKQGMYDGDKNPRWKGGKKMAAARRGAKRRELFDFIPHNKPQENFHGHHLDFNHVIFIPKELHISIYHSVINNINMDLINNAVCNWYLKDQII